ncbi:transcription initiation factor IIE alpha subunit [Paenibacillus sp. 4624]
MSIPTICNEGCNQQFTIERFEIEQMNDGVEQTYFECTHCKKRYVAFYTDPEIRKLQSRINDIGLEEGKTLLALSMIESNARSMNELRKRMEGEKA